MIPLLILPLLFLSPAAPAPPSRGPSPTLLSAQSDEVREGLAALRLELVTVYVELAEWCQKAKLYEQRDLLFEGLIGVDPEHAEARKRLKYRWNRKENVWEQGRYRRPKDHAKPAVLAEFHAMRLEKSESLRERLLLLTSKPGVSREKREGEARLYLALDPEDAYLRRAMGQVSGGEEGVWLSADAVRTKERRAELKEMVAAAHKRVPRLERWDVGPPAHDIPLPWTESLKTTNVRATGTVTPEEIRESIQVVHMLGEILPEIMPSERYAAPLGKLRRARSRAPVPLYYGMYTIYLLQGPHETPSLLTGWPDLSQEEIDIFPRLSTGWLDTSHSLGVWEPARAKRLDGLVRQVIGMYMGDNFSISTRHGWIWEGMGMYLTYLAIGTRFTFFVPANNYESNDGSPQLGERLMAPDVDWLAILVEEMQKRRPPRLVFVVGKDVNSMGIRDLLMAYGLSAYLIEMHPDLLSNVLRDIGRGAKPVEVLEREFGRPLPLIERDILEWAHTAIRL